MVAGEDQSVEMAATLEPAAAVKWEYLSLALHVRRSEGREPLKVDVRPLCSATGVLYARARAQGHTPPQHIAGLMLASILSDSLGFRSPTTTEEDKVHAGELAKLAKIDLRKLADDMLEAKARVDQLSPMELLKLDSKVYTIDGGHLARRAVSEGGCRHMSMLSPSWPFWLKAQGRWAARAKRLAECELGCFGSTAAAYHGGADGIMVSTW